MDIDDILRDVDAGNDVLSQRQRDLQALTRAWVAERSCPEVLECVIEVSPCSVILFYCCTIYLLWNTLLMTKHYTLMRLHVAADETSSMSATMSYQVGS